MSEKENEFQNSSIEENQIPEVEENIYISKEPTHNVEKAPKKRWYVFDTFFKINFNFVFIS